MKKRRRESLICSDNKIPAHIYEDFQEEKGADVLRPRQRRLHPHGVGASGFGILESPWFVKRNHFVSFPFLVLLPAFGMRRVYFLVGLFILSSGQQDGVLHR
jgi:hypothetical protein